MIAQAVSSSFHDCSYCVSVPAVLLPLHKNTIPSTAYRFPAGRQRHGKGGAARHRGQAACLSLIKRMISRPWGREEEEKRGGGGERDARQDSGVSFFGRCRGRLLSGVFGKAPGYPGKQSLSSRSPPAGPHRRSRSTAITSAWVCVSIKCSTCSCILSACAASAAQGRHADHHHSVSILLVHFRHRYIEGVPQPGQQAFELHPLFLEGVDPRARGAGRSRRKPPWRVPPSKKFSKAGQGETNAFPPATVFTASPYKGPATPPPAGAAAPISPVSPP